MSTVKLTVNGKAVSVDVEDRTLLVHLLRENLNLTLRDDRLKSNASEAFDPGIVEDCPFVDRCDQVKAAYVVVRTQLQAVDSRRKRDRAVITFSVQRLARSQTYGRRIGDVAANDNVSSTGVFTCRDKFGSRCNRLLWRRHEYTSENRDDHVARCHGKAQFYRSPFAYGRERTDRDRPEPVFCPLTGIGRKLLDG